MMLILLIVSAAAFSLMLIACFAKCLNIGINSDRADALVCIAGLAGATALGLAVKVATLRALT